MKVTNMKDLLKYVENKKRKQAHDHYEMAKVFGECKGMGNRRYKIPQKSTFRKGKSYAYKGRWAYYSVNPNGHYKLNTSTNG